ncbi:transposase [Bradyrhizobium erythrophlei]|uniref:IS110 family transposase n=1 Tax=Bradyrhizobium erythrophlei TaxID=1437360 RepID=UPI0035E81A57
MNRKPAADDAKAAPIKKTLMCDASDAYLLADLLRNDGHRWTPLSPQSDSIRALRALVRARDDLVAARLATANQLNSKLDAFWPGAASIFAAVESPISLAFLRRYPTPAKPAPLGEAQLGRFCRSQHYSGRRSASLLLLARLSAAPQGHTGEITTAAMGDAVLASVAVLESVLTQLALLTRRIERFVESLPDGWIIMSFPRAGRICAAQLLAELGDV